MQCQKRCTCDEDAGNPSDRSRAPFGSHIHLYRRVGSRSSTTAMGSGLDTGAHMANGLEKTGPATGERPCTPILRVRRSAHWAPWPNHRQTGPLLQAQ